MPKELNITFEAPEDMPPMGSGGFRGGPPMWIELYRAVKSLRPGGPVIRIRFPNKREAEKARGAVNNMRRRPADGKAHISDEWSLPVGLRQTTRTRALHGPNGEYELWVAVVKDE